MVYLLDKSGPVTTIGALPGPNHNDTIGACVMAAANNTKRVCTEEGCERPYAAKGLCHTHYVRLRRTGTAADPTNRVMAAQRYNAAGERCCSKCRKYLPVESFAKASTTDGLQIYCRRCNRNIRLADRYGLSGEDFVNLLEGQGNACWICKDGFGSESDVVVDHDHSCCSGRRTCGKCVRGLLCIACNVGLGIIEDKEWLGKALDYLTAANSLQGTSAQLALKLQRETEQGSIKW